MNTRTVNRSFCIVVIIAVLTVAVVTMLARNSSRNFETTIIAEVQKHLYSIAATEAANIEKLFVHAHNELSVLANNPKVKKALVNGWTDEQGPVVDSYYPDRIIVDNLKGILSSLYRLNASGVIQSGIPWNQNNAGTNYSNKPGISKVIKDHKPCISPIFTSNSGIESISVCQPVFEDEKFIGILRAVIHLSTIRNSLNESNVGNGAYTWIVDNKGIIISHPDTSFIGQNLFSLQKEKVGGDKVEVKEVLSGILAGNSGACCLVFDLLSNEKIVMAWSPLSIGPTKWSICVTSKYDRILAPAKIHSRNVSMAAGLLIVQLILGGTWFLRNQQDKVRLMMKAQSNDELNVLNEQLSRETANLKRAETKLKKEIKERSLIEKQLNKNMLELEQTQQATLNITAGNGQSGKAEFSGNILVAEDARTNQVLIKSLLERLGLNVTVVEDGNKAVQQALSQQFDLIFTDIEMPNINGYEAAKAIRKEGLETPIIALTAYAMKGDEEKCFAAGCNDYISKPIEHKKLLNILGKYLLKGDKDMSRRINSLKSDVDQLNQICSETASSDTARTEPVDEKFEKIPVDLETIQKIYDDREILKETVKVFLEDAPHAVELLAEAITAEDSKNVKLYAHKLRGLARHVAARKLSDMLFPLETKARQEQMEGSEALFAEIQTEFNKLKSFLSQQDWIESAVQQTGRNKTATKT